MLLRLISRLPLPVLYALFGVIAWLTRVGGWRRDLVDDGLARCLPEKSPEDRSRIAREFYAGLAGSCPKSCMGRGSPRVPGRAASLRKRRRRARRTRVRSTRAAARFAPLQLGMVAARAVPAPRRAARRALQRISVEGAIVGPATCAVDSAPPWSRPANSSHTSSRGAARFA